MCMSFTDIPMTRQEQVWVGALAYANRNRNSAFWQRRADGYRDHLAEVYRNTDTADLVAHKADLEEDHRRDAEWEPVVAAVEAELKARADLGALL